MLTFYSALIVLLFIVLGYGFGNILFGDIFSLLFKKDVRKIGSGNVGGTNSIRAFGKLKGLSVMFLDAVKSYITIICCWGIFIGTINDWFPDNHTLYALVYIGGLFAVIGHCFPIKFLMHLNHHRSAAKWVGGKGMSSTVAIFFVISPYLGISLFEIWFIVLLCSRYVSLSSILSSLTAPFLVFVKQLDLMYLFGNSIFNNTLFFVQEANFSEHLSMLLIIFTILFLCSIIILIRHKTNLINIHNKKERKIFDKKKENDKKQVQI